MQQPSNENPSWDEEKWERFFSAQEAEEAKEAQREIEGTDEEICYLEDLFVYQLAKDFADEAVEYIKGIRTRQKEIKDASEEFVTCSAMVSAYIAAGHALGYHSEMALAGNVAMCRRGLRTLKECYQALKKIESRYGVTIASLNVKGLAEEIKFQLESWIAELRERKE